MKQQIDDARRLAVEQARVELLQLRPDAGQAGQRGKQRVEHERAACCADHAGFLPAWPGPAGPSRLCGLLFKAGTDE